MSEKHNINSAYRHLKSPNSKTRDRALKRIKNIKAKNNPKR